MINTLQPDSLTWPFWRKLLFRFFFILLLLELAPWSWLAYVPGTDFITQYPVKLTKWAVTTGNAKLFHVRKVLVPTAGSGDTSFGWAEQSLYLTLALIGCLLWSVLDGKRNNYIRLNYWLSLFTRYYISSVAFSYGIIKLFALQMPFPNLSQLATPLGDFLPMRLSWMFIGYSGTYQIFSGAMEVVVGILLLFRRTTTLGVLLGTAVFANVMMLNMSYDIPVKIFSMVMVMLCLFLLANEYKRIACFLVYNKPASVCSIYDYSYSKKWAWIIRIIVKLAFVIFIILIPFYESWQRYTSIVNAPETKPIKSGVYDVTSYVLNNDTIPLILTDTIRWKDVIFERAKQGSINTSDTSFRQRYKRGYFAYTTDTVKQTISFTKLPTDSAMHKGIILVMRYELPDSNTIRLWGKQKSDSLFVELKRSNRHYQLAEKQFHWLSEYNR